MYIEDVSSYDKNTLMSYETIEDIFSIESELERQVMINACRERARDCGCLRGFDDLIASAKRELKQIKRDEMVSIEPTQNNIMTIQTDKGEVTFNSGSWRVDQYGIYVLDKTGKNYACPHPIFPSRILRNAEDSTCKIEIVFQVRSGRWRTVPIPRSVAASSNKIVMLADYGVQVTSENAKLLVKYLSDIEALNSDLIYEQTSTSRLGWVNGVFVPYCDGSVVFDNEQSLKALYNSVTSHGSYSKWMDCMKEIRQSRRFEALVYMAASFASILVEPCGTLPFIVSIWGGSGKGKTVALMMAASIWADPNEGKYMADAKATTTAMEIRLDTLNSLPMCLDDMAQVQTKFDGDFSQLIYYWCQGKGRERSNQQLGLNKPTRWSNCTLTNGERSMITDSTQGGAINRVIDIEIDDTEIFKNGNKTANTLKKNYGFAGREFVELVQTLGTDSIYALFEKYMKLLKEKAKEQGREKEDKQLTPMALILTADELTESHIFKDGVRLDLERCLSVLKDKESVSEHRRAYEYIEEWVAMNLAHFKQDNENIDVWGQQIEGTTDTFAIIKSKFDDVMKWGGFQAKAFVSWGVRNHVIKAGHETNRHGNIRHDEKVTLANGTRPRCYVIRFNQDDEPNFEDVNNGEAPFE